MAFTNEDFQDIIEELIRRPDLWNELCCRYPHVCCPPDKGLRGGGGGGRRGPQGPPGPASPVLNTYTFSTEQAVVNGAQNWFFEFSGTPTNFGATGARALSIQDAANTVLGETKLPTRAGFVSAMNLLFSLPRTGRAFVDINGINIPISPSFLVPANVVTPVPIDLFQSWSPQDRVLVGFTDQSGSPVTIDLIAEVELTLTV